MKYVNIQYNLKDFPEFNHFLSDYLHYVENTFH